MIATRGSLDEQRQRYRVERLVHFVWRKVGVGAIRTKASRTRSPTINTLLRVRTLPTKYSNVLSFTYNYLNKGTKACTVVLYAKC